MSYNYDLNPWDDTPTGQSASSASNPTARQYQQQPTHGYSATGGQDAYAASGYSNPTSQYVAQDAWNQDPYASSYGQQQGQIDESMDQQQQQQQHQQQYQQEAADRQQEAPPSPPGLVSRFLRARVPMCGTCMDLTSPILDTLLKYVNRDLLASKIFYFFFYSAFGSLFPLMGVYFKQLGMNPSQVGILTGVRPFIEIFSAPFWNSLAERFQKSRMILLFSLISWIVFTYSLAHIRPPASACVAFNDTDYVLYTPYSANDLSNYDVGGLESPPEPASGRSETTESGKGENNEVFMNKLPPGSLSSAAKDAILVDEENVNDQGRRRRRRRKRSYTPGARPNGPYEQIPRPARYTHLSPAEGAATGNGADDEGYLSSAGSSQIELDLENDFDDTLLDGGANTFGRRFKRSPRKNVWGRENGEDEQGESEPTESDEAGEESERAPKMTMSSPDPSVEGEEGNEEQQAEEDNEIVKQKEQQAKHHQAAAAPGGESSDRELESKSEAAQTSQEGNKTKRIYKQRHKTPPTHIVGMSPITVEYAVNYNKEKHGQFVTPMFSTIVYKLEDIKEVFFLLLLLISLGEFFSAPAITIADSTTLSCLGPNTDLYGRQRMFGSIGWAITLMLVGMALDNSKTIADHPCGPHVRERSYTVCFTIFSLLMGCALVAATQFKFNYPTKTASGGGNQKLVTKTADDDGTVITTTVDATQSANIDDVYASTRPREIFNTAPPVNAPQPGGSNPQQKFEFIDKWKSAVFAQSTWEPPEWLGVFRQFGNPMHLTYLFITWFLGCGVGLVFTFLFWHLQDVGGTPTLFGICSVINHISEILAYFFSSYFIKRYGHTKVLSVGLGCNVIRFLYVAFLSNPYYALPFELVQGITHAACFAACCSYMSHVSKPELKASTQGVMQGLHNGIGRACGALLGGYMINAIGSRASFCIYGLLSGCVLGGFLYARKRASDDGDVKVIDDGNLGNIGAPQGVPEKVRF